MKLKCVVLLLVTLLFLNGCSGYREIERGYLVTALGFKSKDGKVYIYAEAISSSNVTVDGENKSVLKGSGNTVDGAFKNLKSTLVKPLYFEHTATVILENSLDNAHKNDVIAFLKEQEELNLGIYFVSTPNAESLFEIETPDGILGYDIVGIIKNRQNKTDKKFNGQFYKVEKNRDFSVLPCVFVSEGILNCKG